MKRLILAFLMLIMVCTTVADDYVSYWKFDVNSSVAYDESRLNNGTVTEAIWTTGKYNYAFLYDGVNDLTSIPDSPTTELNYSFTLVTWFKLNRIGGNPQSIVSKWYDGSTGLWDFRVNDDELEFRVYDGSEHNAISADNSITLDTWIFGVAIWNGTGARILVNTIEKANVNSGALTSNNAALEIGDIAHPGANQWFNGTIDEIRIYNRILNVSEIWNLYVVNDIVCTPWISHTSWVNASFSAGYWLQNRTKYDANNCYGSSNVTEERYLNIDTPNFEYLPKIYEVLEMLPLILLWLGLWAFGYWTLQTRNELLAGTMIVLTVPIDVYLAYKFQETFILSSGFIGIAFGIMAAWTFGIFVMIRRNVKV